MACSSDYSMAGYDNAYLRRFCPKVGAIGAIIGACYTGAIGCSLLSISTVLMIEERPQTRWRTRC